MASGTDNLYAVEGVFLQKTYFFQYVFSSRHANIGAVWVGHMDKVPKGPTASVAWEATHLQVSIKFVVYG
jgi:hypothetical protein